MEEIGGYIEFEYNHGMMLHENSIHLNCGRRAFSYLVRSRNIKKVWIPRFSCDSVIEPFRKEKCKIDFYSVDIDFCPMIDNIPNEDWIVIINYYGQIDNNKIKQIKESHPNIIFDNTQAYFQLPLPGVDTVYTCRKFFGVSDGAFLYTDKILEDKFITDESFERMTYLLGRFEKNASEFYSLYDKNNSLFDDEPIKKMSRLTENILHGIDYFFVAKKRRDNFEFLHSELKHINQLKLITPDGPFMYPLFLNNGQEIRKFLISKKIYIPTLWPNVLEYCSESDIEFNMAKNILPLPVDQRYSIEHMKRIKETIFSCLN